MSARRLIFFITLLLFITPVLHSGCSNTYWWEKKLEKWQDTLFWWEGDPSFRTDLKMKIAVAPFDDRARVGEETILKNERPLVVLEKNKDRPAETG